MNYEWEIQKLDLQLRHVREMQTIAHEHDLEYTGNRLDRIEVNLEKLTANVDKLVASLREHSNGKQ
jgi:hypothetical protein